jgi:uncharacterized protein YdeI (YjbR/CyaY-like superfamily)
MLALLANPWLIRIIGFIVIVGGLWFHGYNSGYDKRDAMVRDAELKQATEIIVRKEKEIVIQDRIVKEYVDRVIEIQSKSSETIELIKELPNEINQSCIISHDVIGMYNNSNGFAATSATKRADDSAK